MQEDLGRAGGFGTVDGGVEQLGDGVDPVGGDLADGPEQAVVDLVSNLNVRNSVLQKQFKINIFT